MRTIPTTLMWSKQNHNCPLRSLYSENLVCNQLWRNSQINDQFHCSFWEMNKNATVPFRKNEVRSYIWERLWYSRCFVHSSYIIVSFCEKVYTYMRIYMYTHTQRNILTYPHKYTYICVCLYIRTHIYAYTHIFTLAESNQTGFKEHKAVQGKRQTGDFSHTFSFLK